MHIKVAFYIDLLDTFPFSVLCILSIHGFVACSIGIMYLRLFAPAIFCIRCICFKFWMHMSYFYHFFFWIMRKYEEDTNAVSSMKDFSLFLRECLLGMVLNSLATGLHIDTFCSNPLYKVAKT